MVLAAVLLACGIAALFATRRMRIGSAGPFQPRLFPLLVGWLLIAAAGLLTVDALRTPPERSIAWPSRHGKVRIAVMVGSLAAYILLLEPVGTPLATFLAVAFQVWYLGEYRWHVPLLTGAIAAVIVYLVFMLGLELTLPAGQFLS
jgi:putative tricarboxylic transport membrane protein